MYVYLTTCIREHVLSVIQDQRRGRDRCSTPSMCVCMFAYLRVQVHYTYTEKTRAEDTSDECENSYAPRYAYSILYHSECVNAVLRTLRVRKSAFSHLVI